MSNQYTASLAACCSLFCFSSIFSESASAEPVDFRLWFEGPSEVIAGESATFQAWAEASGPGLEDAQRDALASVTMSILAGGQLGAFDFFDPATHVDNGILLIDPGVPNQNTLENIRGFQLMDFNPPGPNRDNPIHMFDFSVQTVLGQFGQISLEAVDTTIWGTVQIIWEINGTNVASDDPGNSLTIDPFSFQVIPAPGAAALLALAGLGTTRRRR